MAMPCHAMPCHWVVVLYVSWEEMDTNGSLQNHSHSIKDYSRLLTTPLASLLNRESLQISFLKELLGQEVVGEIVIAWSPLPMMMETTTISNRRIRDFSVTTGNGSQDRFFSPFFFPARFVGSRKREAKTLSFLLEIIISISFLSGLIPVTLWFHYGFETFESSSFHTLHHHHATISTRKS